jgi:two-component system cell cycle response regulator
LGLPDDQVRQARHAAHLHDIGKLAVPDGILNKRGTLTAEEQRWLHSQTLAGERITLAAPALAPVARLIRSSHERWDGTGYPDGLAGDDIPLISQIVAVCNTFSTVRQAAGTQEALDWIHRGSGTRFCPRIVEAMAALSPPEGERPPQMLAL